MLNWLKQLFCKHDFVLVRELHGEERVGWGMKIALYQCSKCNKIAADQTRVKQWDI